MTISYHAREERKARVEWIEKYVGYGQVIKEMYGCYIGGMIYSGILPQNRQAVIFQLTDTGIVFVKAEDNIDFLITLFPCNPKNLLQFYNGNSKKIPSFLKKKVDRNFSNYKNYKNTHPYIVGL